MYTLITPALQSAVTLEEAKTHLRVTDTSEDTYIQGIIEAAQEMAEGHTGRTLIDSEWEWTLQEFTEYIILPKVPVTSITAIKYKDSNGVEATIPAEDYWLRESEPAVIIHKDAWPEVGEGIDGIKITFKAGYANPGKVPAAIKAAMYLIIGKLYDNRSDLMEGRFTSEMPKGSEHLLNRWKIY